MSSGISRELETAWIILRITWSEWLSKENGIKKDYLHLESRKKVVRNWFWKLNPDGEFPRKFDTGRVRENFANELKTAEDR